MGRQEPGANDPADLVVTGRVWSGSAATVDAIAVRGERVVYAGTRAGARALIDQRTQVIDAGEGLVVPGFIDTHVHFMTGGLGLASVQLRDAKSRSEFAARIAAFARGVPAGTWILNGDWDHQLWGGELPDRAWIDAATAAHPVFVQRLDGHMALANSAALAAAGIGAMTEDVAGGEIVRDHAGRLTGVLKDNAMELVQRVIPPPAAEREDAAYAAATAYLLARGVTSVHHMGTWEELAVFERARQRAAAGAEPAPAVRILACVPLATWPRLMEHVRMRGRGDDWLRTGCLKGFVDGSLGSHTAAFLEPFSDVAAGAENARGILVTPQGELYRLVAGADLAGLQIDVHAIGDRAIRLLLDIYQQVAAEHGDRGGRGGERRWRIEHAQHIHPDDLPRFAALGVIASMQPYHAIDDGRWADRVIGERRSATTYAFRSLLDQGARVAFGSDWFVAPPTPLEGIYAAVTRRTLDGARPGGWVPAQKITVEEALRAYTVTAAHAAWDEDDRGTLEAGKLADLVVIDRDLRSVPPETIRDARILVTVVGGRVVYRAER